MTCKRHQTGITLQSTELHHSVWVEQLVTSRVKPQSLKWTLKTASLCVTLSGKQLPRRKSEGSTRGLFTVDTTITWSSLQSFFMSSKGHTTQVFIHSYWALSHFIRTNITTLQPLPAYTHTAKSKLSSTPPWQQDAIMAGDRTLGTGQGFLSTPEALIREMSSTCSVLQHQVVQPISSDWRKHCETLSVSWCHT